MADWKALCEELADALACHYPGHVDDDELIKRARAALAEPEPEAAGPTMLRTERRTGPFGEWTALIPCNSPAPAPAGAVADSVAVLEREAEAAEQGNLWMAPSELRQAATLLRQQQLRIALLEQRQAAPLAQCCPTPAPPAAGEVGDLIKCLRIRAAFLSEDGASLSQQGDAIYFTRAADLLERLAAPAPPAAGEVGELVSDHPAFAAWLAREMQPGTIIGDPYWWAPRIARRAADLLEHHPVPVPVAERPWEREGWCDEQGRCWWFCPESILPNGMLSYWCLGPATEPKSWFTHCLPFHALPLPGVEVE